MKTILPIKKSTDAKIEFYLDRAIYRPGQTVYYKGMLSKKQMKLVSSQMF
jgi:uncharacterized protein YfaS (alpha-2-macroglobulin family)